MHHTFSKDPVPETGQDKKKKKKETLLTSKLSCLVLPQVFPALGHGDPLSPTGHERVGFMISA